jgi:hypothetical protein
MAKISIASLCMLVALAMVATCGHAYVKSHGQVSGFPGMPAACPPSGCPTPMPMMAAAAGYPGPMQGPGPSKRITKCKPQAMCAPPMCAPPMCAPPMCGPPMCAPMCMPPTVWY